VVQDRMSGPPDPDLGRDNAECGQPAQARQGKDFRARVGQRRPLLD
jgi:hypothetical protein